MIPAIILLCGISGCIGYFIGRKHMAVTIINHLSEGLKEKKQSNNKGEKNI